MFHRYKQRVCYYEGIRIQKLNVPILPNRDNILGYQGRSCSTIIRTAVVEAGRESRDAVPARFSSGHVNYTWIIAKKTVKQKPHYRP